MSWRDAFLHPWRDQGRSRSAKTPARAVVLDKFAASEPARDDADALGLHADPDETIHAEMAVMAARAAERAREKELDNDRVAMMVPRHRLEYRRMRWETVNAVKLSSMSPQRIEQEYDAFRFAQWEQQNAERIAPMSPGERQESFRLEELLTRYRAGLPARDAEEREAYQEWRQLDADVVNEYTEAVEIPERLWDGSVDSDDPPRWEEPGRQYFDEISRGMATSQSAAPSSTNRRGVPGADAAQSDGSPPGVRTAGKLGSEFPDATGAGRGLGEEPLVPPAMTPLGKSDAQPEQPLLDPPPGPGSSDRTRPKGAGGLTGPVLGL